MAHFTAFSDADEARPRSAHCLIRCANSPLSTDKLSCKLEYVQTSVAFYYLVAIYFVYDVLSVELGLTLPWAVHYSNVETVQQ